MKEQKVIQKTEVKKRVSMKFNLKANDSLQIEKLMQTLRERGWRKEKIRLHDLIMDELFLNADSKFYEDILNKYTPLEYLFKTKMNNPVLRKEMEKILKKKA